MISRLEPPECNLIKNQKVLLCFILHSKALKFKYEVFTTESYFGLRLLVILTQQPTNFKSKQGNSKLLCTQPGTGFFPPRTVLKQLSLSDEK
jgi:hypothetical protein